MDITQFLPKLAFSIVVILSIEVCIVQASFEDSRCRCVCPRLNNHNNSKPAQVVYIDSSQGLDHCTCDFVVLPRNPAESCSRCECKHESRNTTTIKVVVIIIICMVSLLFVYMLFLLCLDPLITRRPLQYQQHADEEDDQTVSQVSQTGTHPRAPGLTRQRSILNRVQDEQTKWKGTVQEQRRNIYDRHSMLN